MKKRDSLRDEYQNAQESMLLEMSQEKVINSCRYKAGRTLLNVHSMESEY